MTEKIKSELELIWIILIIILAAIITFFPNSTGMIIVAFIPVSILTIYLGIKRIQWQPIKEVNEFKNQILKDYVNHKIEAKEFVDKAFEAVYAHCYRTYLAAPENH